MINKSYATLFELKKMILSKLKTLKVCSKAVCCKEMKNLDSRICWVFLLSANFLHDLTPFEF